MFENFKGKKFTLKPNKKKLPINEINFDKVDLFNHIYLYCQKHFIEGKTTKTGSISYQIKYKYHERYYVIKGNQRFELIVVCAEGCYRFVLRNKKHKSNRVAGIQACREIYKKAKELKVDLKKYISSQEEGLEIKKTIESPHIEVLKTVLMGKAINHVYHMDLKSSYASRIVEAYPETENLFRYFYDRRNDDNDYYKHILTNSIGCFQSEWCLDIISWRRTSPYQLSKLSKVAINGTRNLIIKKINSLRKKGFIPLLTNTDGIWYYSPSNKPYHDKDEGNNLGQWENDHCDCKFIMTSKGSYQYVENGVCKTVLRGICELDVKEPDRDKWNFKDILKIGNIFTYRFDSKKGVIKTWQD